MVMICIYVHYIRYVVSEPETFPLYSSSCLVRGSLCCLYDPWSPRSRGRGRLCERYDYLITSLDYGYNNLGSCLKYPATHLINT